MGRPRVRWAIIFGVWTLVGLFFATRPYVHAIALGIPAPPPIHLLPHLTDAWTWAAFTPAILWLADRFRLERGRWSRSLVPHLAAGAAFATLSVAINVAVELRIHPESTSGFARYFAATFHFNFMWYGVLVGVGHALETYRKYRSRELRASQLEAQLTRAQLSALRAQLQPHFLFNTLNAISELVHVDPVAADRMVSRLGELLRLSVDNAGAQEVTLRQELGFLDAYVEIQRIRYGDRLRVEMRTGPGTLNARVPNLVLQPLVENAIKHGIAPRRMAGEVWISAVRQNGTLRLRVEDNGAGLPEGLLRLDGVGLSNTRARLEQLYGPDARLDLRSGPRGGAVATVLVPYRPVRAPAEPKIEQEALS